jgi:hypothetical protein
MMAHLADSGGLNPRVFQTYIEESFVGAGAKVYKKSVSGPYDNVIQGKILKKWCLALSLRWSDVWQV